MNPVKFEIIIETPIGLPVDLQKDLHSPKIPRYRILNLELQRMEGNTFKLAILFHPDDITPKTETNELLNIRDLLLSLLSTIALMPVELRSKGTFTFALGNRKFQAKSLGTMKINTPSADLHSLQPLLDGQFLPSKYSAAMYFIWQAINSYESIIHRFINTAICVELLTGSDSPEPTNIYPKCGNKSCNYTLELCPSCKKEWKIPNPLRNRSKFLIPDDELLTRFIKARNKVFHGASQQQDKEFLDELREITTPILLAVRNHIGGKINLPPLTETDINLGLYGLKDMTVSIFYTMPEETNIDGN